MTLTSWSTSKPYLYKSDEKRNGNEVGSRGPNDVLTKFTWNYGGSKVSLTGSFNNWQVMIPM